MINKDIKEYIRLVGSLSLDRNGKERVAEYLIKNASEHKEYSGKYVAVASAIAFLAVGTLIFAKGIKQDINIM